MCVYVYVNIYIYICMNIYTIIYIMLINVFMTYTKTCSRPKIIDLNKRRSSRLKYILRLDLSN